MSIENTLDRIATALETIAASIAAPAPTAAPATAEELNALMVKKFTELGNDRAPIDAILQEFGVIGVTGLKPEQYQDVYDKVNAL